MRRIKYLVTFILIIIMCTYTLTGCNTADRKQTVVTVGSRKLTLDDFRYDIFLVETEGNKLESYYSTNFGISYWDNEKDGRTMRELAKDTVMTKVIMHDILADQASKAGLSLTDEDIADNTKRVDDLINTTPKAELDKDGLTRDLLIKAYNKISLGDKFYKELAKCFTIDKEAIMKSISPEEYREYKTECLYVSTVSSSNQQIKQLSKGEITAAYDRLASALKKIKAGADFDKVRGDDSSLIYYTRDFILKDSIPEKEYRDTAARLKKGDYSDIVGTNYGYYIIHMLDDNSTGRYEKAVDDAVKAEENKQFEAAYTDIKAKYDIKINDAYWNTIVIGNGLND